MDTAKIFVNGRSQAVRLPKDYRFAGSQVFIKRVGNAVMLLPEDDPWQTMVDGAAQFSDDFMVTRDQGEVDARENF